MLVAEPSDAIISTVRLAVAGSSEELRYLTARSADSYSATVAVPVRVRVPVAVANAPVIPLALVKLSSSSPLAYPDEMRTVAPSSSASSWSLSVSVGSIAVAASFSV